MEQSPYRQLATRFTRGEISRRELVRRLAALGLGAPAIGAFVAACGGSQAPATTPSGSSTQTTSSSSGATTASPAATTSAAPTAAGTSAAGAAGQPKKGGTLRVAIASDLIGIDPQGASAGIDRSIYTSIYNGLVSVDDKLNIVPDLAVKWDTPDPKTYVFTLRPGVKFHDGTPCDADAVKKNFDWMLDPANASPRASELADLSTVTVQDPTTVTFVLKDVFSPFLSIITDRAGYIVSPTARAKYGKDYTRNPVGTGPFQFVEWLKDDHITFKRFDGYFEPGIPYLDQIIYKPITDSTVALTDLKTNTIDFLNTVDPKDAQDIKSTKGLLFLQGPGVGYTGLWLNLATGPLANQSLRSALSYAVDRDALLAVAYFGIGQVAGGPIPPSSWAYDPSYPTVKRDVTKAKAALAAGGKPSGFQMVMKVDTSPLGKKITELIQEQVKEVGIDVQIQTLEFGALLQAGSKGDFDAMSLGWSGRIDPDGNIQPIFGSDGAFNYGKYKSATIDDLIKQGRQTTGNAARAKIYQQLQKQINDDVAYIFTYFAPTTYAVTTAVQGFKVTPDGLMRFKTTWMGS